MRSGSGNDGIANRGRRGMREFGGGDGAGRSVVSVVPVDPAEPTESAETREKAASVASASPTACMVAAPAGIGAAVRSCPSGDVAGPVPGATADGDAAV